jgi:hypothetical protein
MRIKVNLNKIAIKKDLLRKDKGSSKNVVFETVHEKRALSKVPLENTFYILF